ncbi:MAG: alpha/beta hydrolase-fold protein [Clostridia bacterium]|nr:alpha/beta hydrolase-fold protein [Clostridia bacterium]
MTQSAMRLEKEIVRKISLDCLLYVPQSYDRAKAWPLVVFLHGSGEKGNDLDLVKVHGIPRVAEHDPDLPFLAVSPQCPHNSCWDALLTELYELVCTVKGEYSVDANRVYLTGLSMGGHGTWLFALEHPREFAAIVPICGWLDNLEDVCKLKGIPTWAFHGAMDPVVPLRESERVVDALKGCGGDVRFTVLPKAEHDSWTAAYDDPALYSWMLAQTRVSR